MKEKKSISLILIISLTTLIISSLILGIIVNVFYNLGVPFNWMLKHVSQTALVAEQHPLEPTIIQGWQFIEPISGQQTSYYSLDFVPDSQSSNNVFGIAGGTSGVLNYFQNNEWTVKPLDVGEAITGIDLLNTREGWLTASGMGDGKIFRFNGSAWNLEAQFDNFFIADISAVSTNEVWACGSAGSIFHYQNGSWSETPAPLPFSATGRPSNWLFTIDMYSSSFGAVGGTSYMVTYVNGQWNPQAMVKLADPADTTSLLSYCVMRDVDMVNESDGWAVGDCKEKDGSGNWVNYGGLFRWQQGNWQEHSRFPNSLTSISMASVTKGWLVGDQCTIAMYDGSTWQTQVCPIPEDHHHRSLKDNLKIVRALNDKEAWVVGRWGIKLYYNEDGAPAQNPSSPPPKPSPNGFWLPFLQGR